MSISAALVSGMGHMNCGFCGGVQEQQPGADVGQSLVCVTAESTFRGTSNLISPSSDNNLSLVGHVPGCLCCEICGVVISTPHMPASDQAVVQESRYGFRTS